MKSRLVREGVHVCVLACSEQTPVVGLRFVRDKGFPSETPKQFLSALSWQDSNHLFLKEGMTGCFCHLTMFKFPCPFLLPSHDNASTKQGEKELGQWTSCFNPWLGLAPGQGIGPPHFWKSSTFLLAVNYLPQRNTSSLLEAKPRQTPTDSTWQEMYKGTIGTTTNIKQKCPF